MNQQLLMQALDCDNEQAILEGFMDRYQVSYQEAEDIFKETKKWLWLASQSEVTGTPVFIDKPLMIIDEMWHTFILHTRSYYNFCLTHFQKLVHHNPTSPKEKEERRDEFLKNPTGAIKKHEEQLRTQYNLIYDNLGPETLLKWYDTMAQKYTPEYIRSIKKY
ncbi:MAG: hypothetical protein MJA30_19775 [Cytophagales bacterium]|nr:hypothetical protein [Cytophagales bacterium]